MKTRLSAWKYIKNNKRTVAVLVTALSLSFMAMYTVYVLLITTPESFRPVMLEMPKRISCAALTGEAYGLSRDAFENNREYVEAYQQKQSELIEKLKKIPGIEDAFYTQILGSYYQAVIGSYSYEMPLMEVDRIPAFLRHMDAELVQGNMPAEPGEVLIDETVMKNRSYRIGDWFQKEWYGETFRITGAIRSKYLISVGIPNGYTNNGEYIVIYNDEHTTDLKAILEQQGIKVGDEDDIVDAVFYRKEYREAMEEVIETVLSTIYAIVMVFLAILVIVAYVSFLRNRVNEYCLYASIGYSRAEIYGMVLREMAILFGLALAAGLLVSLGISFVIHRMIIWPRGLVGYVFYGKEILHLFGTYLFLAGVLQIPILFSLQKIRTIDAIEE